MSTNIPTTLSALIQQVRWRADFPETNQYVTDTELTQYINDAMLELDDILLEKNEHYRMTIQGETAGTTTNTITNKQKITLPPDFDVLNAVHFYYPAAAQPWVTLKQFSVPEWNQYNYPLYQLMAGMPPLSYMLCDGYVAIAPEAVCAGTYRLLYTPALPQLVNLTDTVPYYFDNRNWTEYIVIEACIAILTKQQEDPSSFMAKQEKLRERITNAASKRDAGAPKCGRNTRRRNNDNYMGLPYYWK